MTPDELYQAGCKAYDAERYEEALSCFTKIAGENADAASYIPLCYLNWASDVSLDASNHADNTEYLVRGQQLAVKILDTAIRSSLRLFRVYPDYPYVCQVAATVIAQSMNLQYSLVSTGLTTAYNITSTKTTTRKTVERTMLGEEIIHEEVLWEEVLGTETESFVSLTSYDMSDYHIIGPDEKTLRVKASLKTILENAIQVAHILDCLGHEYDGHILRASVACAMAESDGGDRSLISCAQWFIARAKELAQSAITDQEVYSSWESIHEGTMDSCNELSSKYAALLRSHRKQGLLPRLGVFYQDPSQAPAVDSCTAYVLQQQANAAKDQQSGGLAGAFEVFLTVFAQISFMKVFPTILFSSIVSLFCGGLIYSFTEPSIFGIVFFVVAVGLTFFRSVANSDEFTTRESFLIYMATMLGTAVLFSIHFLLGLAVYLVLGFLAKKYK